MECVTTNIFEQLSYFLTVSYATCSAFCGGKPENFLSQPSWLHLHKL